MKRVMLAVGVVLLALLLTSRAATAAATSNEPPVAVVTAELVRGIVPLKVCFDASKSHHPEGKPLTYHWDFGDGRGTATTAEACHEYVQEGLYAATVTVTDDSGAAAHRNVIVFVGEAGRATPGT